MIRWVPRSTQSFICSFPLVFFFFKFEMLLGRLEPDGTRKVRKWGYFMLLEKWQLTSFYKIKFHLNFVNINYSHSFCFVAAWLHWQVSQRYTKNNWACGKRFCRKGSFWRGSQTFWSSQGILYILHQLCVYMYPLSFFGFVRLSCNHFLLYYYRIMKRHW